MPQRYILLQIARYASRCADANALFVEISRPEFLCPPASIRSRRLVKSVQIAAPLCRVAEVGLVYRVRNNNYNAEVFTRSFIMKILYLGA